MCWHGVCLLLGLRRVELVKAIQTSCNLEISCNLAFELKSLVYKANSCSVEGLALSIRLDLFLVLVPDWFAFPPHFAGRRCWKIIL